MYWYGQRGNQLRALEMNILKYRALQMVMLLFHVEDLKSFVLESVNATQKLGRIRGRGNPATRSTQRITLKEAWRLLVSDGVLTQEEHDDLQRTIDYRNHVAHRIHKLVSDVTPERSTGRWEVLNEISYDYDALDKLRAYRKRIELRMQSRYIMSLSFRSIQFEAAERAYQTELSRLERKIDRQLVERKRQIETLKAEIAATDRDILEEIFPDHPRNFAANGQLTQRGIESGYRLFDLGLSPLAVGYLMGLSLRSTTRRQRAWSQAGGIRRPKRQLSD